MNKSRSSRGEPPEVPVVASGDGESLLDMAGFAGELVSRARSQGVELAGDSGLLTAMVRQVLRTGLNIELAVNVTTTGTYIRLFAFEGWVVGLG